MNRKSNSRKWSWIQLIERRAGATGTLLLLLLVLGPPAVVQAQFTYTTTNGTITITGYTGPGGDVIIPDTINGLQVTSIGDRAFASCGSLTSVTIPDSVASIEGGAFEWCGRLSSVAIPNSVTNIGNWAFNYCGNLTNVTIPNSVTSIGVDPFGHGYSLTAITVGTRNSFYSDLDGVLFNRSLTTLVQYPGAIAGSYAIPNSVTSIGDGAFNGCGNLTNVTIPNSVTNIGDGAFADCGNLTNVTIPNSVTNIGDGAFADCGNLTSITIPNSVTSIGSDTFYYCTGLTNVILGTGVTSIGDGAFDTCTSLTNVILGTGVTSIGDDAFDFCESLTSVTIPNSVTNIGDGAFDWCTSLTNAIIGNGLTSIGQEAFSGCTSLTSVYFQGNAPSFGADLFEAFWDFGDAEYWYWDPATIYYLPGTTGWSTNFAGRPAFLWDRSASMGYMTHNGTVTITRYTGPGGAVAIPSTINGLPVTTIGDYYAIDVSGWRSGTNGHWVGAFDGCTSLTSITIPNSVTSIGDYVFSDCTNLTSVTIPNSVTSLGTNAFFNCTGLASVTIPNSVTSIGVGAFGACTSLMAITVDTRNSVYSDLDGVLFNQSLTTLVEYPAGLAGTYTIPNSVTSIGDDAFSGCSSLTSVTIPNSVTSIGDSAFSGCTSLTNLTIGNSVTNIADSAFNGCGSLTSVYFQGNAPSLGLDVFYWDSNPTAYYLPGTTGWSDFSTNTGLPTALWTPQVLTTASSFGVRTNQFGFNINWASGLTVVVEASTSLVNPTWHPISTNTLTSGSAYFSDPQWTNYPARFYRLRSQ